MDAVGSGALVTARSFWSARRLVRRGQRTSRLVDPPALPGAVQRVCRVRELTLCPLQVRELRQGCPGLVPPVGRTYDPLMGPAWFVYWQEESFWLGYLEEFPDYLTQGESFEDLKSHLRDLHADLAGGHIPAARRVAVLDVA